MARKFRDLTLALIPGLAGVTLFLLALAWPASALVLEPGAPMGLPVIQVNYAHEWVQVTTIPQANLSIVVAHGSKIQYSDSGQADSSGNFQFKMDKSGVDMVPGDAVTVTAAGREAVVNPIGAITGSIDMATDRVSGTIQAPWPGSLTVACEIWVKGPNTPSPITIPNVLANGGDYLCDFSGKWTIRPGDEVAISYYEPDGDRVINVFRAPAPDVWVSKRGAGSDKAAAGGQALFTVQFGNQGTALAEEVVLTDTLPANTAYVTDTSGMQPFAGPGSVVWHAGNLAPGSSRTFYVVLATTSQVSNPINNHIEIATSSQGDDQGNNQADGQVQVVLGQPSLFVNKSAFPGDPLAGDSYNYAVGYGNNGPVASGPVWLTDYLPFSTTVVSWKSQNGFEGLWTRLPGPPDRVIFYAPALAGSFDDQLILRLRVDPQVPLNTQLINNVCIGTRPHTGEQCFEHSDVWTGPARYDLGVSKAWGNGQLTPGGVINYQVSYNNNGNATAHNVWLTETLPSATRYITSVIERSNASSLPFPPTNQAGQTLAWSLGTLSPGANGNFRIQLQIDANVTAGTVITNQAQISTSDPDGNSANNLSQAVETVYAPGPNLRLRKSYDWRSSDGGQWPDTLSYRMQVENIGSETVNSVRVTDTLPASTSFSGRWWNQFWRPIGFGNNPGDQDLVWTLQSMEPGWSTSIGFDASLDQAVRGTQGLVFTNTAQITTPPGDPSPADNTATAVAFTGPDLYVQKSLKDGDLYPGELITFTVKFGNRNVQPWRVSDLGSGPSVILTETLPSGLTFVSATRPRDPSQSWQPYSNVDGKVVWNAWPLGDGQLASFDLTARISPGVPYATVLTAVTQIADVVPGDAEAYYANNQASASVRVGARVYVPLIHK